MSKSNHRLILLLCLHLVKGVVTGLIVPLWEFPDEQAHAAEVSYLVETGYPVSVYHNLSHELYESERILGTLRDHQGRNQFTYRPYRKHSFSTSPTGPQETYLRQLPQASRTTYVKNEATYGYPPFYHLSSLGYRLTHSQSIFERVFATRLISVVLSTLTIYIVYHIGLILFQNRRSFALALAAITSFHPMFSFVSSGINNDNLSNLLGALLLLICLNILATGLSRRLSLLGGLVIGLGIISKPLMFPLIPGFFLAILFEWRLSRRPLISELKLLLPLIVAGTLAGGWTFIKPILESGYIPHLPRPNPDPNHHPISLLDYSKMSLSLHYRQTLVWYFGVFKWLGVVFPLTILRLIKIVLAAGILGLASYFFSRKPSFPKPPTLFLLLFSLTYILTLSLWDWLLFRSLGFSHGLQGRYFFPTITAHLGLWLIGLFSLFPSRFQAITAKSFLLFMIALHSFSLLILSQSYYHLNSWTVFFNQLSQYKPLWFKYPLSLFWISLYILLLSIFIRQLLKNPSPKERS